MILTNNQAPFWALDISDLSLKLVALAKKRNTYQITNYGQAKVPTGCFDKGKIIDEDQISNIIKEFILTAKGGKIKSKFVKACLPERHTFIKLISIPKMTEAEIPSAVEWAAEHHLPFSLEEIYFDWQILDQQLSEKNLHILIGAAPRDIVDSYTNLIKKANLVPLTLEIEAVAIARALINPATRPTHEQAIGIIDLGASRSSFIIYAHNTIQFSFSLPLSGEKITQSIVEKLNLSQKQAEEAKIICGVDSKKCKGGIQKILQQELETFTTKIQSTINYYEKNFENVLPIKEILLCGGGANMKQFSEYLSANLNIKTAPGSPATFLSDKQTLELPKDKILSFTTAIGLALNQD